jgi:hypothetical protein
LMHTSLQLHLISCPVLMIFLGALCCLWLGLKIIHVLNLLLATLIRL